MTEIWMVWCEGWDYREVESVHGSLDSAKAALIDLVWPLAGPRGGKRKPRPAVIEWDNDASGTVYLRSEGDYCIERREVAA